MQVRVRMYRQGLGDCFLLTFGTGAATRHVLIDCGTLGTTTNNNPMADVVAHIRATTNDHLHAVIGHARAQGSPQRVCEQESGFRGDSDRSVLGRLDRESC